jgi:hypothetical protein
LLVAAQIWIFLGRLDSGRAALKNSWLVISRLFMWFLGFRPERHVLLRRLAVSVVGAAHPREEGNAANPALVGKCGPFRCSGSRPLRLIWRLHHNGYEMIVFFGIPLLTMEIELLE